MLKKLMLRSPILVHRARVLRSPSSIVMSGWAQQRKPTALQQLETLERPPTALARDDAARSALVDGFASGLSVVELRGCWDACVGEACGVAAAAVAASPGKRTPRLATREPACRALLKRCAGLVVEDAAAAYDADRHVPRECGLQMAELGWPARRDDADAFFVHGYMHASACVTLAVLSRCRCGVDWRLVFGRGDPRGKGAIRFNVSVPRAIVPEKGSTLRERSERSSPVEK